MKIPTLSRPLLAIATLCAASLAAQAQSTIPADASNNRSTGPQTIDANGVRVVSGGVTLGESTEMRRMARQFPLRVVISTRDGSYDVAERLQVMRNGSVVAEVQGAGPWVLMNVPPGQYTLRGEFDDGMPPEQKTVRVGQGGGAMVHWVRPRGADN